MPTPSNHSFQPSLYSKLSLALPQVTNPPIDPLREGLVMSMEMRLGGRGNLLSPSASTYQQVLLKSPILLESELAAIQADKVSWPPSRQTR